MIIFIAPIHNPKLSGSSLGLKSSSIEVMIRDGFRSEQGKGMREKEREVLMGPQLPIRVFQAPPTGRGPCKPCRNERYVGKSSGQPSLTRVSLELGTKS
jgi:hypothetical protein